jgi:Phage integrase family
MLRHPCGYALANEGHDTRAIQDWLGHRAIQHTALYTELSQRAIQGILAGINAQKPPTERPGPRFSRRDFLLGQITLASLSFCI